MSKVERIKFTDEEKVKILSKSKNRCAHCGKKLTIDTMTVEHMYPIDKGGGNEEYNLIALCEKCNQDKSNFIYDVSYFTFINYSEIVNYERQLLNNIYNNITDSHLLGKCNRIIRLIDTNAYNILKSGRNKKMKNKELIGRAISKEVEFREMLEGDFDEEAIYLIGNSFESVENNIITKNYVEINKYVLRNMTKFCTFYGAYINNIIKAIYCFINISELDIKNTEFLDEVNSKGFNNTYVLLFASVNSKYTTLNQALYEKMIEFTAVTNNLVLFTNRALTMKELFRGNMNNVKTIDLELTDKVDFLYKSDKSAGFIQSLAINDDHYNSFIKSINNFRKHLGIEEDTKNEEEIT